MNITVFFCDKHSSCTTTIGFEAETQQAFNAEVQEGYLEASANYDKFSIEAETIDGDEGLLDKWLEEFDPREATQEEIEDRMPEWKHEHLQFARLLHELDDAGAFTPQIMESLVASMNLEESRILELLKRATCAYDDYAERHIVQPQAKTVGKEAEAREAKK